MVNESMDSERIKNAIKCEYDQKLETHKAHLKARSEVEIEKFQLAIYPKDKRRELASDAFYAFREYYQTKSIFLPAGTAQKLNNVDSQLATAFNEFVFKVEKKQSEDPVAHWIEIWKRVGGKIAMAFGELEGEFRLILGEEG